jgi:SAM-dependent methyltransferase
VGSNQLEYSQVALQKVREDRLLIDQMDQWLYKEIAPYLGHRVLEIGCGVGNFARYLTDRELYVGTDVAQESVERVSQQYRDRGNMRAVAADVTSPAFADLADLELDTAFSLNVFEHIEDDGAALSNAAGVLQPSGALILIVPAHGWLYGSMDAAIGHYRRYDRTGLAAQLRDAGLELVIAKYINAAGAAGWFFNGRIRRQTTPPAGQLRLFNGLVPWLSRLERRVPPPFGISLLAVGRKPDGPGS